MPSAENTVRQRLMPSSAQRSLMAALTRHCSSRGTTPGWVVFLGSSGLGTSGEKGESAMSPFEFGGVGVTRNLWEMPTRMPQETVR